MNLTNCPYKIVIVNRRRFLLVNGIGLDSYTGLCIYE